MLGQLPGIGPSISAHLDEYLRTGKSKHFLKVFKGISRSVFKIMRVPTLGPKKAYKLAKALKLINEKTAVADLKKKCLNGEVAKIEGFGQKSEQEIISAINQYESQTEKKERMILPYASELASQIINYLKKNPLVDQVDALGSLRRMVATVGDIDIAVKVKSEKLKVKSYEKIIDYFINYPRVVKVNNAGEKKASIVVRPDIQVDLRVQESNNYGSMLQYFTGSKSHNVKLREYALRKGYSLSEYGIKKIKDQISKIKTKDQKTKLKIFSDEKEFYNFLGLQYIPPEIREGTEEITLASKNQIPKLVELTSIKGDLHIHSSYDVRPSHDLGKDSVVEIVKTAKKMSYEYVGFADHNPSISTNSENKIISIIKQRRYYIDKLFYNKKIERSDYFIGLEVDIKTNGQLALPDKALDHLDYIIVGVHSAFNMEQDEMTKRILTALDYPKVRILAHPTGRLLMKRDGYELDWKKIFDRCKKNKIALEINAFPDRLDLPDVLVKEAIESDVKLIINTDAHQISQMKNIIYGVATARRGWAKKIDIINSLNYNKIKQWLID